MADPDPKPKLCWWQFRRGWLRFSLRSLLVLLTVACLGLGWLANRANQQRQVVKWVTDLGGYVVYDYELDEQDNFVRNNKPAGPDWLRDLIGIDYFADVVVVDLGGMRVSDLTPLANLTKIEQLLLSKTQVNDLTPLANLTHLEHLYLSNTQVSDLTPLVSLKSLKFLSVAGTKVSKENRDLLQRSLPGLRILGY